MTTLIRRRLAILGVGVALTASSYCGVALAEDPAKDGAKSEASITKSCKWDIAKFALKAKKGEIKATLAKNIDKLSPECKKAVDESK
jgi:hypothetical protein